MSLNQTIFLKINQQIGKRKWFDLLMYFLANWLIYVYIIFILIWGEINLSPTMFKFFIKLLLSATVFAIVFNWLVAILVKKGRPITDLPKIKTLFSPIQNWKGFPSDHATLSFVFLFVAVFVGIGLMQACLFFMISLLICFSRVYSGVHYPRDIAGGFLIAFVFSWLSYYIVMYITQPFYLLFINIIH